MRSNFSRFLVGAAGILILCLVQSGFAAIQYSNDFENPSDSNVQTAWSEWVIYEGGTMTAQNGRIEWDSSGGNNDWIRLDLPLPLEYTIEFDYFQDSSINGRFSVWPFAVPGDGIFERNNYFLRANTHYFNQADTVPSEGPRDLTLPAGSAPHRIRVEVSGNHVILLYKDRGQGGWIKIDERDFPALPNPQDPRYFQFGYNHDSGDAGLVYADNIVVSFQDEDLFYYSTNFNNPSSPNVETAFPEWDVFEGGSMNAVNNRIEWDSTGGDNDWMRLTQAVPENFIMEFDFFYQADTNGRFSVWPLVLPGESIANRHNYFLRANTHYYNLADTVPSEGPRDMTLPLGANPHRVRFEVTGDHVVFLYKDRGEGGWIKVDERDFPPFPDGPRYVQIGYNHDGGDAGLIYVDNFEVRGMASDRAVVDRNIQAEEFMSLTPVPVELQVTVTGTGPVLTITEDIPEGWSTANISHGGVFSNGQVIWNLQNLTQSMTLTYEAIPPRLIRSRTADFSGNVTSGDEENRITGETLLTVDLPYLYREAIDLDFSGSPVDGRNYPTEYEYGERYTQGMDGIPADTPYTRPGGGGTPAVDTEFVFQPGADFFFANPGVPRDDANYAFDGYRDDGEITFEKGASDTGTGVGGDRISVGDWFRYTFDLGEEDQVLILNISINSWNNPAPIVDVYIDNRFKAEINVIETPFNAYNMYTVGPFEISGGVHSIVLAIPGPNAPDSIGRMEVVRVQGIGEVTRILTQDGFFDPSQPLQVSLQANARYGSYAAIIEEDFPEGSTVTDISDGGQVIDGKIVWELEPTQTSTTVTYTVQPPAGARFLLFNGFADIGLPLADDILGDVSVTNQAWLFGENPQTLVTDEFEGSTLSNDWTIEYGSDPAIDTDYTEGVDISVGGGKLLFNTDPGAGNTTKFDEYSGGRRAPFVVRTDLPDGDWRVELEYTLVDTLFWTSFGSGIVVAYNEPGDTSVVGDEYIFGLYADIIQVELTGVSSLGTLNYHNLTDEVDWLDMVLIDGISVKLAVTRRGNELIFSAQLPGRSWQLVGRPVTETREANRVGVYTKIFGDNYANFEYEYFTIQQLDEFTAVTDWALY